MAEATGATTPAPPAESGPRTDRLELLQQCGGTIGVVHKARNPKLARVVALRQLQVPDWLDNVDELIKRILDEARSAGALDHPNIARLLTAGYKGFTIYLTSEFVEAPNIRDYAYSQNLGVPQILALGRQLCAALEYSHQKKILHYALTPSNLKVLPDGTLKVLDFGLLREKQLYSPTPAKRLESEHYLSPEQIRNKPMDARTNLFSAATIIYELLTTRNPFAGKHLGEVDRNITDVEPASATMAHSRVPEAISRVLIKALAKDPAARYQTAAELAKALEEATSAPAKPVAAPAPAPASATTVPQPPVNKPATVIPISSAKPTVNVPSNAEQTKQQTPVKSQSGSPTRADIARDGVAVPAKPATTMIRAAQPVSASSKIPAKIMAQWKLVGAAVAVVFVVSAMAISFNHRSKVSSKPSEPAASEQEQPIPVSTSNSNTSGAQPVIEIREIQPKTARPRMVKAQPVAMPVVAAEGQLEISSDPDGATVLVEGKTTQTWKTPQIISSLSPGVYKVTVSKAGYATETRSIEVRGGSRASLEVTLASLKASLTVAGTPAGARIIIDGRDTGKLSPSEFSLDPAVHNIALHKEGFFDSATDIKLSAGQTASYSPTLKPAGRTDNIKVVGGGIKKIFGVGGGSSEGMSRLEIKSDPKGAQITINGTALSKTTPVEVQVEPGNYEITLEKDGYKPVHRSVSTQANDKVKIDEQLGK